MGFLFHPSGKHKAEDRRKFFQVQISSQFLVMCGTWQWNESNHSYLFAYASPTNFFISFFSYLYLPISNVWLHFSFEYFLVSLGSLLLALRSAPTGKVIIKQITPQGKFSSLPSDYLVFIFIFFLSIWENFCKLQVCRFFFDIFFFPSFDQRPFFSFCLFYVVCSLFYFFRLLAGQVAFKKKWLPSFLSFNSYLTCLKWLSHHN